MNLVIKSTLFLLPQGPDTLWGLKGSLGTYLAPGLLKSLGLFHLPLPHTLPDAQIERLSLSPVSTAFFAPCMRTGSTGAMLNLSPSQGRTSRWRRLRLRMGIRGCLTTVVFTIICSVNVSKCTSFVLASNLHGQDLCGMGIPISGCSWTCTGYRVKLGWGGPESSRESEGIQWTRH